MTTIKCNISGGMFKSERVISVTLPDGREITAFVDRQQVIPDREIASDEQYPGEVKVSLVGMKKDSAIVDLPQGGLGQGPRVEVSKKILKKR